MLRINPASAAAARAGPDSSSGRSGKMNPSNPASFARCTNGPSPMRCTME